MWGSCTHARTGTCILNSTTRMRCRVSVNMQSTYAHTMKRHYNLSLADAPGLLCTRTWNHSHGTLCVPESFFHFQNLFFDLVVNIHDSLLTFFVNLSIVKWFIRRCISNCFYISTYIYYLSKVILRYHEMFISWNVSVHKLERKKETERTREREREIFNTIS